MMDRPARRALPLGQILLIVMGIVILYLLIDFGRLVGVSYQRRKELHQVEQQLLAAQDRQAELQERLAFAQSDAAVEEWARENGMAQPDEMPVVIVAPAAGGSLQQDRVQAESTSPDLFREAWWDLFFGSR